MLRKSICRDSRMQRHYLNFRISTFSSSNRFRCASSPDLAKLSLLRPRIWRWLYRRHRELDLEGGHGPFSSTLRGIPSRGSISRRPDAGENRADRLRCWCKVISSTGLPKHRTEFLRESYPVLLRRDRPTHREIFHAPQWASH